MSTPKLTERQLTNITSEIKNNLVDTLCNKIMDETAQDAGLISGIIKKTLGEKIGEVLSKPANEEKISETFSQAVNSSLRNTIKGPLLLHSLLDNRESFIAVKSLLTKIFANVYNNSSDKSIASFVSRLLKGLNNPPYNRWFKQDVTITRGGKKSKTMRKRKGKKRSKTYRNIVGGRIGDSLRGISAEKRGGMNEKNKKTQEDRSAAAKSDMRVGWAKMKSAWSGKKPVDTSVPENVSDKTNGEETNGEGKKSITEKMKSMFGYGNKDPDGDESTGDGGTIPDNSAELIIKEYNEELMNRLTKRIDETQDELLERVLNAGYKYATDSGIEILNAINKANYRIIQLNNISSQSTNVIIIQALYASSKELEKSINVAFEKFIEQELAKGEVRQNIKFNPKSNVFMADVLQDLTTRVKSFIDLSS